MKKAILIFFFRSYLNTLSLIAPQKAARDGFFLFCRPRRRPVKPHHLEFLNTSYKFTMTYDGKKVQGYRWGEGERKVLLLHGWESHSYWWKSVVSGLSKEQFTIYSIDAPGHGLSEGDYINVPHYSGLIEQIILEKGNFYAILGHSLGAFSAVYTLYRVPLPVSKLVVMASPGEAKEFFEYYQKVLGLSRRSVKLIGDFFVKKLGHAPEYFSVEEFAKKLTIPGLIIHDTKDTDAPYAHALEAHKNWSNSKMISTTGLGHNLKSTDLIKEVEKFLN